MLRPSRIALVAVLGAVGAAGAALFAWSPLRDATSDRGDSRPDHQRAVLPDRAVPMPVPTPAATPAPTDPPDASLAAGARIEGSDVPSAIDPADAGFVETWGEPTPELLRASIEAVVAAVFVDRTLTAAELERATQALVALRTLRSELDALPMEPAHAARRRALVEDLGRASESFHDVMDMSPSEFTTRAADATGEVAGGVGIDRGLDSDYVPDDDFLPSREAEASEP